MSIRSPVFHTASCSAELSLLQWFWLLINCAFTPFNNTAVYNSINSYNYSKQWCYPYFPSVRAFVLYLTRRNSACAIVCPTQSYLAIILSPSIFGHVCGGVLWRWRSRITQALKLKKGDISLLYLWNWYCNMHLLWWADLNFTWPQSAESRGSEGESGVLVVLL